jgi:septal ring factor EnvC (AmiA/AmiB activator)
MNMNLFYDNLPVEISEKQRELSKLVSKVEEVRRTLSGMEDYKKSLIKEVSELEGELYVMKKNLRHLGNKAATLLNTIQNSENEQ